jgi:hypothetical protein
VFFNRRDAQNGSDLASLAGTKRLADFYVKGPTQSQYLFTTTNNVYTAVQSSLGANGCVTSNGCDWTARYVGARVGSDFVPLGAVGPTDTGVPAGTLGVRVDVHTTPRTYFLGILGQSTWDVRTTATSITGTGQDAAPGGLLLPIAMIEGQQLTPGNIYAITSGANGPGNFGWLSWTGSNDAGALAASLCTPNNPSFTLPAQFPGDPGATNASDVRACLQFWVDSRQPVLIPIVEKKSNVDDGCRTGGNGNNFTYCIIGFVAMVLTDFDQPAIDQINGRFVTTMPYSTGDTIPGGVTAPPSAGDPFYFIGLAK